MDESRQLACDTWIWTCVELSDWLRGECISRNEAQDGGFQIRGHAVSVGKGHARRYGTYTPESADAIRSPGRIERGGRGRIVSGKSLGRIEWVVVYVLDDSGGRAYLGRISTLIGMRGKASLDRRCSVTIRPGFTGERKTGVLVSRLDSGVLFHLD